MKKFLIYWGPTLLWMGLIFYLSTEHAVVASPVAWQDFTVHKSAHVILYGILAVWFYRSLRFTSKLTSKKLLLVAIVLAGLYGVTDEFHQNFTPTRTPALRDVVIDFAGAAVGSLWAAKIIYAGRERT